MPVLYTNNALSNLSASITNSATSLSVTAGTGVRFPNPGGSDYFYATITDASGEIEIVRVTSRMTDSLTVVRGQDGTTARAWGANANFELRVNRAMLDDFKTDTRDGNAATATALQTARTIGGVSFNGTANINLPGVNTAGNQNTTGSAASLTTARAINGTNFNGTAAITTANWGTDRTLSYTGDVTGSASVNGGANVAFAMTLANSGVTAGTYTKFTVDAKGRVTAGDTLVSADLPTYTGSITSSQVTTALGFTPYNDTNPSGFITSSASITGNAATATTLQTARTINGTSFNGSANVTTANWGTARTLSFTGDVTGSASVNGSANVATAMTLANSGVTAGTYTFSTVTVDAKGRVTSAASGQAPVAFPAGTRMLFQQTTAPTGWTKDTTHDNKALRVVSGTVGTGGSVAFTTAFASQAVSGSISSTTATNQATTAGGTVGSHTLTVAEMPSHRHGHILSGGNSTTGGASVLGSATQTDRSTNIFTPFTGGGGSHSHSFSGTSHNHTQNAHTHTFTGTAINMAVQYVDFIIATKD
jgi:hypothetical protein